MESQYSTRSIKFSITELTLRLLGKSLPFTKLFSTHAVANSFSSPLKYVKNTSLREKYCVHKRFFVVQVIENVSDEVLVIEY